MSDEFASPRRVTDRFAEFVDAALQRHGEGEEIHWESQMAPNDQGGLSLVLIVWLPSGTVGDYLVGSAAFHGPPPALTAGRVDETVRAFLAGLRGERSKALTAAQNGAGSPAAPRSGLILP